MPPSYAMLASRPFRRSQRSLAAGLAVSFFAAVVLNVAAGAAPDEVGGATALPVDLVLGPSECVDCHSDEHEVWLASAHEAGSRELTRSELARDIARELGIHRIKKSERCTSCHFTLVGTDASNADVVAGVSCESCHGASLEWIDVHKDLGEGVRRSRDEDPAHRAERYDACDELGMVRPAATEALARRCVACHGVADEELVAAGHPAGADFELVAWSQGEVRHNFVRGGGTANAPASPERRRELFAVGRLVALEHAVVALADASGPGAYADGLAARIDATEVVLRGVVEGDPGEGGDARDALVALLAVVDGVEVAPGADVAPLTDAIARALAALRADGAASRLASLDAFLPGEAAYVGRTPR